MTMMVMNGSDYTGVDAALLTPRTHALPSPPLLSCSYHSAFSEAPPLFVTQTLPLVKLRLLSLLLLAI